MNGPVAALLVVLVWAVPTVLWIRTHTRLERLRRQLDRDTVIRSLNRGSIVLDDREYRMNAERAGHTEIWVWS